VIPLPEGLLSDPGVRVALAKRDYEAVAVLVLLAAAGWDGKGQRGVFPDDTERVAAILGVDVELATRATAFWEAEGWIKRENGTLYLPWMTKAAAEEEAGAKAAEERARSSVTGEEDLP
jgi:hypothetical protein